MKGLAPCKQERTSDLEDAVWRQAREAAAPLQRGSAVVFTYGGRMMSGELDDVSSCGMTIYGREDGRRYLVGSQDVRRETELERDRRERLGYFAEDDQPLRTIEACIDESGRRI